MSANEQALLDSQAESALLNDKLKSQVIKHDKVKKDKQLNQQSIEEVQGQVRKIQENILKLDQQIVQLTVQTTQRQNELSALGAGLRFKKTLDLEKALTAAEALLRSTAGDVEEHDQTGRTIAYIADLQSQREAVSEYENQAARDKFDRESARMDEIALRQEIAEEQKKIATLKLQEKQCENAFSLIHVEEELCTKNTNQLLDKLQILANKERELQIALRLRPDPPMTRKELLAAATSGNSRKRNKGDKGMRDWTGARMNNGFKGGDQRRTFEPPRTFETPRSYEAPRKDKPQEHARSRRCASFENAPSAPPKYGDANARPQPQMAPSSAGNPNRNLVKQRNDLFVNTFGESDRQKEARLPPISPMKLPPSVGQCNTSFKQLHLSPPNTPRTNLVKAITPPPTSTSRMSTQANHALNVWTKPAGNLPLLGLLETGYPPIGPSGDKRALRNSYGMDWPLAEDDCWAQPFEHNLDKYGGDEIAYFGLAN